jgi:hypothetical protein
MVTRAAPAKDWLTPLAVLIPIGATPPLALWALSTDPITIGPVFALVVLATGLTAIAVAGRHTYGTVYSLGTAIFTWVVAVISLPFWYAASVNSSVCGKEVAAGWAWLPPAGASLVFLAVGSFGLRTQRGLYVAPFAGVLALTVLFLLVALVPGAPGFCD